MRFLIRAAFLACLFAFSALCLSSYVHAAAGDFTVRRIEFGYKVRSGNESISSGFQGLGNIGGFPQKWAVITAHFDSRPTWADEVMLKYYVLVRDSRGKPAMLTGNVTYVSVHAGLDHDGFVFIHPNTMARYGTVKRILVEIWYRGVLVDSKQWPNRAATQWWNKIAAVQGTLRPRFYTPFEHDYEVREEDIKLVLP